MINLETIQSFLLPCIIAEKTPHGKHLKAQFNRRVTKKSFRRLNFRLTLVQSFLFLENYCQSYPFLAPIYHIHKTCFALLKRDLLLAEVRNLSKFILQDCLNHISFALVEKISFFQSGNSQLNDLVLEGSTLLNEEAVP